MMPSWNIFAKIKRHGLALKALLLLAVALSFIRSGGFKSSAYYFAVDEKDSRKNESAMILQERPPLRLYKNLSCPFEWSKYSCFHAGPDYMPQAKQAYAFADSILNNHNQNTALPLSSLLSNMKKNARIVFTGDSLIRQVFIALACRLWMEGEIEASQAKWENWPLCHAVPNCITTGPHSGFQNLTIRTNYSTTLHVLRGYPVDQWLRELKVKNTITVGGYLLNSNDVLMVNFGLHIHDRTPYHNALDKLGSLLLSLRKEGHSVPSLYYMTTYTQHFKTPTGAYSRSKKDNITLGCKSIASSAYKTQELALLTEGVNVDRILSLNDSALGGLHVGFKDCSHYCLPGVPDVLADQFLTLLSKE